MNSQKDIGVIFLNFVHILNFTWEVFKELTVRISHTILGLRKRRGLSDLAVMTHPLQVLQHGINGR